MTPQLNKKEKDKRQAAEKLEMRGQTSQTGKTVSRRFQENE